MRCEYCQQVVIGLIERAAPRREGDLRIWLQYSAESICKSTVAI